MTSIISLIRRGDDSIRLGWLWRYLPRLLKSKNRMAAPYYDAAKVIITPRRRRSRRRTILNEARSK